MTNLSAISTYHHDYADNAERSKTDSEEYDALYMNHLLSILG
jgi:hypothetical protein